MKVNVLVYFVIRNGNCELATNEKKQAEAWVESFNRHRRTESPAAELREQEVEIVL